MKIIKTTIVAMIVGILVMASPLWAAVGTVTQSIEQTCDDSGHFCNRVVTFTCTGGTAGDTGTYPATAISSAIYRQLKGWYLYKLITNPGSPAPEDNWDFTLVDEDGVDVLGGAGANRHTTTSQQIAPMLGSNLFAQPVLGAWTLTPTGNTTSAAVIVIKAIFAK